MSAASALRSALAANRLTVAPGCYDAITARAIGRAGYPAVYMTGAGTAATNGFPDYGLLTMTEMVANAARIARSVSLPVIADADTGYGNELNVVRAVQEYARAGVAAIHIEDQTFPKRCGHLANKTIIPRDEYIPKIRAAADHRPDPDFIIIARTDARAVTGLDDAIDRANAALDAGADVAFVEAPQTVEELAEIPRRVRGPCLLNYAAGGRTPMVDLAEVERMGYRLAILPALLMNAALRACDDALAELRATGRHPMPDPPLRIVDFTRMAGGDEWDPVRDRYSRE